MLELLGNYYNGLSLGSAIYPLVNFGVILFIVIILKATILDLVDYQSAQ